MVGMALVKLEGPPRNNFEFALKLIFNYGLTSAIAVYLVYQLVQVFLPALIEETRQTNVLLSSHVTSGRSVEIGIPILINLSTQNCINNATTRADESQCFRVASGDSPASMK